MSEHDFHELDHRRTRECVISKGGQISLPASIRRRWGTERVRIFDLGDRLVVRPIPEDPVGQARGSLRAMRGLTADRLRVLAREAEGAGLARSERSP